MLTRDSAIHYLSTVTVAPVTSTVHGVPSEVALDETDGMKGRCVVNLHNVPEDMKEDSDRDFGR